MSELNLAKLTLRGLAKTIFQYFGLTADVAIGFDDNGQIKNVSGLGATITEGELALTDVTTADSSASKHGFLPKLPNDNTKVLDGTGAWVAKPASTSLTLETPTGAIDGENDDFVFLGTPVAVFRNGVMLLPSEVTIVSHTATLTTPPPSGIIQGLVS